MVGFGEKNGRVSLAARPPLLTKSVDDQSCRGPAAALPITASFLPPVGLGKVTLTVAKLRGPNQSQQMPPVLKPGQYPARRRIDFIVGGLDTAGFYELNVSGEDAARQPWSDSYVIYRP